MTLFRPNRIGCSLALAVLAPIHPVWAAENPITYTLPRDGRVSRAVYNERGHMVRTLRNAEPQTAGKQTAIWDGLDLNGNPAPAGNYTWKLLLSQGMKAEYLLNLGVSSGINHWIGQHGGPQGIAVDGDAFTIGASPEGSPLLVKAKLDGGYQYAVDNFEPAGFRSLATDGGTTYVLMDSGKIFSINAATGAKPTKAEEGPVGQTLLLEAQTLEAIPPAQESKTLKIPVKAGRYLLRVKAGQANAPSGPVQLRGDLGDFNYPATDAGKFATSHTPTQYSTLLPKAAPNGSFQITFSAPANSKLPWAIEEMKLLSPAESIDARFGELLASFPGVGILSWLDPKTAKIEKKIELPDRKLSNAVLIAPGTALAISGDRLMQVSQDGKIETKAEGLTSPVTLAFDPSNGGYWIAEGGKSQQVKFFDKDFQLKKTFGRAGGRLSGAYVPEDFLAVSGIAADGKGGFLITEADSAPRRAAHFDADGRLFREWIGGQQFYTFAAPDPENSDILWMDSQWGWIMKIQIDWDKRDWKVLATYRWGDNYTQELFNRFKMARPHRVMKLDLDKDGKKETYLVDGDAMQRVDEDSGRLRLVSTLSMIGANHSWEWSRLPLEKQPQPWVEAIRLLGDDPAQNRNAYRAFAWADANGDNEFQAEEMTLAKGLGVEARRGAWITDDLSFIRANTWGAGGSGKASNYNRYPVQGFTASGAPIWDWAKSEGMTAWAPGDSQAIFFSKSGDIYQIIHGAGGDGYKALGIYTMAHSYSWPGTQTYSTGIWKWNAQGELQWIVGPQATRRNNDPGQMHYPVHFAGLVNGTIGVCDKIVQPVVFWTEDGLYAGGLLDHRTEDGLPPPVYSWWNAGTDDFDPQTGRAAFQFDMALGGSLIQRPNGDVIFIGSGWNSSPAYRVTGWENFERREGKLAVRKPSTAAARQGSGLAGDFFANGKLEGTPAFSLSGSRIWFEPARAKEAKNPAFEWPVAAAESGAAALPADQATSARWTGEVEPSFSENYTFHLYHKDGSAKLWLGGRLIVETRPDQNKASSAPVALKAGEKYDLKLEWSGRRSGELHLSWQSLSQPVEHIPVRALYPKSGEVNLPVISLKPSTELAYRPGKGVKPFVPEWILSRSAFLQGPVTVDLDWSGSARPGVDYAALPEKVTFNSGQKELRIPVRLLPSAEIAGTRELRGNVRISPQHLFDGSRGGEKLLIADSRIQPIVVSEPTVEELEPPAHRSVAPNLNTGKLVRLVDRSGIDESKTPPTHDTGLQNAWLGEWLNLEKLQLRFDLGGHYRLAEVRVWNFNTRDSHEGGWGTGNSVRWAAERIRISVAKDFGGPWTELEATSLRRPAGNAGDPGQLIPVNQDARYVRITFPERNKVRSVGLAEVEFFGTPLSSPPK